MTIARYLAQLAQALPWLGRRRFLREAEAHLRDAAERLQSDGLLPEEAEARAVAAFGPVDVVARRVTAETAPTRVQAATVVALVSLLGLIVPLYGIPENTLPPAPWDTRPTWLSVLVDLSLGLWLLTLAVAVAAVSCALVRRPRPAVALLSVAAVGGVATVAAGLATTVAWRAEVPQTPVLTIVALVLPAAAVTLGVALGSAAWARAVVAPPD